MAGEHDHGHLGHHLLEDPENLDAVDILHLEIEQGQIEVLTAEDLDRLRTAVGLGDLDVPPGQTVGQDVDEALLVVDQQELDRLPFRLFPFFHGEPSVPRMAFRILPSASVRCDRLPELRFIDGQAEPR